MSQHWQFRHVISNQASILIHNIQIMDEQSQNRLIIKENKVYSRKELKSWVTQSGYNFDELNNGLFFLKLLQQLIPNDAHRQKIYGKANNPYEYIYNLKVLKKLLNKHGLQKDMNPNKIAQTKNCFQLATWFKNLYEQNKTNCNSILTASEFILIEKSYTPSKGGDISGISYKSPSARNTLSRATSSDTKNKNNQWMPFLKSKNKQEQKGAKFSFSFYGNQKLAAANLISEQFSKTINFSRNKSQSVLKKKPLKTYKKELIIRNTSYEKQPKQPKPPTLTKLDLSDIPKNQPKKIRSLDENLKILENEETSAMMLLMKKESLLDNIGGYEKILDKIREYVSIDCENDKTIDEMREEIRNIIYMKNA